MNKKIVISFLLVVIWMAVIFFFSSMEMTESNDKSINIISNVIEKVDEVINVSSDVKTKHQSYSFIDQANHFFRKFSHASVYFALAILLFNLLIRLKKQKLYINNLIIMSICFLYACTDEFHQTFVMGRTGQFIDVLIDILGAFIGCIVIDIIYHFSVKHFKKRKV